MQNDLAPDDSSAATPIITEFLLSRSKHFKDLTDARAIGWQTTEGDQYFKDRRDRADNASEEEARGFFTMTCQIANDLDKATSVFAFPAARRGVPPRILDMGMAPGGFTSALLRRRPRATVRGVTLPPEIGGLEVMLPNWRSDERLQIEFLDVTMLADEMGTPAASVPGTHADSGNFSSHRPFSGEEFDLVICGAAVQRAHARAAYRESRERLRLITSQLVVALDRVREGGSLVLLLHKPEAWSNVDLLNTFTRFSEVRLFKPRNFHAIRSSCYMVATKLRPRDADALAAVSTWMARWNAATFGDDAALKACLDVSEDRIRSVLESFGLQFIALATPIWKIQAARLRKVFLKRGVQRDAETANGERAVEELGLKFSTTELVDPLH